jgi:phosphoglycerate dehydrogenase-like enzyme
VSSAEPRPRVLFSRETFTPGLGWGELAGLLPGWDVDGAAPGRFAEEAREADVVSPFGAPVDRAMIEAGGFGLIQQFGVGLERVDVEAATECGVVVARLPADQTGNAASVAEIAVLHVLAVLRRLDEAREALRSGQWNQPLGRSLSGLTVLVVGLGALGVAVVERLVPFGCSLIGMRARPELGGPPAVRAVFGPDRLAEALGRSDVVICCAMFSGDNAQMFDADAFAAMRPGSVFINVARGGLVDEAALLEALESGVVAGAGLDVHAHEPADPASALLRHPHVVATPHVAGLTDYTFSTSCRAFAENVQRWAAGEPLQWTVNAPGRQRARAGVRVG